MKAVFDLAPSGNEKNVLHLIVEADDYSISFLWFKKDPFLVKGLVRYHFNDPCSAKEMRAILGSQESFLKDLSSATVCFNTKESLLIPEKYYNELENGPGISLLFGEDPDSVLKNDLITSAGIYNQYRLKKDFEIVFSDRLPNAVHFHSTSLQLEQLNGETNLLYCILDHKILKAILIKDGKLQIVQQFNYTVPEDVAFYLLNICEQFEVKPAEITLRLTGMLDEQSKLYLELYRYFLNIGFENVADGIFDKEELRNLPAHFFSHLTSLALCVS